MLSEQTREREAKLKALLTELSNEAIDECQCEAIAERFKNIYSGGFRHRYSVFHPLLQEIMNSSDADQGVSEFLTNNLNAIRVSSVVIHPDWTRRIKNLRDYL